MKRIVFMRHSYALSAVDTDVKTDALRPLSDKGIAAAEHAAIALEAKALNPKKILTSPRLRAKQTADILTERLSNNVPVEVCTELDGNTPMPDMWQFIKDNIAPNEVIVVVGHNPDLSALVTALSNTHIALSPAEFAILDFTDDFTVINMKPLSDYTTL
ncbi:phosphohistidine phosphatase [Elusimicrobium simillimum]|uniref:SixA phosphatase family protein n=1 Tax=Elusimicrobium simillimum TaxID=3143438 RepID=UPI003C702E9C